MRLLLLDLDNTLVDRAAAFHRWATWFAESVGGSPADVEWLVAQDADGYQARETVGAAIADRFRLPGPRRNAIVSELRDGLVEQMTVDPAVVEGLQQARNAGWMSFVVTNGTVSQQERKLRHLGLDQHLAGWVISEGAGSKKPDSRIFRLAADQSGLSLTDSWMIGDHPAADIGGAQNVGASTCWLRRGRVWAEASYRPAIEADDCATALSAVLAR